MIYDNNDPEKGNNEGKQSGNDSSDKKQEVRPDDPKKEKDEDKFSPGEPDDYNAEEFSTD